MSSYWFYLMFLALGVMSLVAEINVDDYYPTKVSKTVLKLTYLFAGALATWLYSTDRGATMVRGGSIFFAIVVVVPQARYAYEVATYYFEERRRLRLLATRDRAEKARAKNEGS